jgi:hypothetical protein
MSSKITYQIEIKLAWFTPKFSRNNAAAVKILEFFQAATDSSIRNCIEDFNRSPDLTSFIL